LLDYYIAASNVAWQLFWMTPTMADMSNTSHASASEDVHSIVM